MALNSGSDFEYDSDRELDSPSLEEDAIRAMQEDSLEERFKTAIAWIKNKGKFTKESDVDDFFHKFGDVVGQSSGKDAGNLLHALIEIVKHTDAIKPEHVEPLIRRLVKKHPELLIYVNQHGYNPIFMAIKESVAIKKHADQLLKYMISECVDNIHQATYSESLNAALSMQVKSQNNESCLHVALQSKLLPDTTAMLIQNASEEALSAQDTSMKTPMHYAIAFSKCTKRRVKLISLFIARDLESIQRKLPLAKTFLDLTDNKGSSVYLEHLKSRTAYTTGKNNSVVNQLPSTMGTKEDQADTSMPGEDLILEDSKPEADTTYATHGALTEPMDDGDKKDSGSDSDSGGEIAEPESLGHEKRTDDSVNGNGDPGVREPNAGNAVEQEETISNIRVKRSNNTGHPSSIAGKPPSSGKATDNAEMLAEFIKNSDEVLVRLKLHYMRTRSTEMAIFFLYGPNLDDIQISFDYDRLPRQILWHQFVSRFGANTECGLKFDRVLQYATFPCVEVRLKGRLADLERHSGLRSGITQLGDLGRKDMKYFFDWLYEKGVRHIIKLSVEDSGEKVHSDQAIQESIGRFIVEQLDWQKTDMDPETVLHVSSKVEKEAATDKNPRNTEIAPDRQLKQLELRWSGSNAILRAWSEPEGLTMLPQLQRIYLFKPPSSKTYESPKWIDEKVKQFEGRLNANRAKLKSELRSNLQAKLEAGLRGKLRGKLEEELEAKLEDGLKSELKNELKASREYARLGQEYNNVDVIALDEGTYDKPKINSHNMPRLTTPTITKSITSHRWLDSTVRFAGEMRPFWQNTLDDFLRSGQNLDSLKGVADDVVVALIDDGVDAFDTALDDQVSTSPQAIQAALDKKATIISMSWALPVSEPKAKTNGRLRDALQKAVDKKVLMFCSAPDEGKFSQLKFPRGPWRNEFFCIGAARADGTIYNLTHEDTITYAMPGVDVIKDQFGSTDSLDETPSLKGVTIRVNDFQYETGSSVATALAAGLAAMIIYCIKASILAMNTANQTTNAPMGVTIPNDGAELIAHPDPMKLAFDNLGEVTTHKFIQVWEELDKSRELVPKGYSRDDMKFSPADEKDSYVFQIARSHRQVFTVSLAPHSFVLLGTHSAIAASLNRDDKSLNIINLNNMALHSSQGQQGSALSGSHRANVPKKNRSILATNGMGSASVIVITQANPGTIWVSNDFLTRNVTSAGILFAKSIKLNVIKLKFSRGKSD
ncbi:hypothetical protein O1611_g1849 [Lasiodiplodia mahajangana]|uniref:Uncharacterized protein n=1 Tax=Lasiodiplodia mahajangana TaxID=1108764 RepID=A0ACC2JWJ1_9PEZI|nr:hypothetical protein O1611_g1849 [Lasiodiplodia mahajangana]